MAELSTHQEMVQAAIEFARERDIPQGSVLEAIEQALQKLARHKYGQEKDIRVSIHRKTGHVEIHHLREVVEHPEDTTTQVSLEEARKKNPEIKIGEMLSVSLPPVSFGHGSVQSARQVLIPLIQDMIRQREYEEFKDRKGDIVNALVKREDFGNYILDLGSSEAFIPRDQLIPREKFRPGDRVRCYIKEVERSQRGHQIIASRTDPQFLVKLFEQEVPEVYDGLIEIKAVARDPGSRAKIGVFSRDTSIDPVGSCVGVRGSRVQAVIHELQGEKIDIIPWSSDVVTFTVNALAPAEVIKVVVRDEASKKIEVVVPDDQLSLAIGRRGQNVRLAGELSHLSIDILTETDESKRRSEEVEKKSKLFMEYLDIDEVMARLLVTEDFETIEDLVEVPTQELSALEGFTEELAEELQRRANEALNKENKAIEEEYAALKGTPELREFTGFPLKVLLDLAKADVRTVADLGDLSGEELKELVAHIPFTQEEADALVMKAREEMDEEKKSETTKGKKPLSLVTSATGKKQAAHNQVRQSFSYGRSRSVTVEIKRRKKTSSSSSSDKVKASQYSSSGLTSNEQDARLKALKDALEAERHEEELRKKRPQKPHVEEKPPLAPPSPQVDAPQLEQTEAGFSETRERKKTFPKEDRHISDNEEETGKKKAPRTEQKRTLDPKAHLHHLKNISLTSGVIAEEKLSPRTSSFFGKKRPLEVQDLANRMSERVKDVLKKLAEMGQQTTGDDLLDPDTAELLVTEMGHRPIRVSESDIETSLARNPEDDAETYRLPRPPVVTIMGHVDHGKTSLLDVIRRTSVTATESGGITQHIGAYQVTLPSGQPITFLDTPGHEAFTAMRARGATITDIVILVVAADDGIKAQTVEAIHHAQAAKVPIIVAINKIDKKEAQPDRVRTELLSHELVVEKLGGEILDVEVSAIKETNIDKLLESIVLQAELMDLRASAKGMAEGTIVEARLDKGRGTVATALVRHGTLKIGQIAIAGVQWGKVRALFDDRGQKLTEALPSQPVEILGFDAPPKAGDLLNVAKDEETAREIVEFRLRRQKDPQNERKQESLQSLMLRHNQDNDLKELHVILKGDVQGSIEAIIGGMEKMASEEVAVRVLHQSVGGITEGDIRLAQASNALILAFNVRAAPAARKMAEKESIEIRYYSIIYQLLDEVKDLLSGLLTPTYEEKFLGYADVRQVFNITKVGKIAGCFVTEGVIKRGAKVRLLRDQTVIYEGTLKTLKRHKDEVKDVRENYECGAAFEGYQDLRAGDVIECFEVLEIKRSL
eukprot:g8541.t1